MSQEPTLFATTIEQNILFGRENATRADVEAAARAANVHAMICKLPDGYDTQVCRGTAVFANTWTVDDVLTHRAPLPCNHTQTCTIMPRQCPHVPDSTNTLARSITGTPTCLRCHTRTVTWAGPDGVSAFSRGCVRVGAHMCESGLQPSAPASSGHARRKQQPDKQAVSFLFSTRESPRRLARTVCSCPAGRSSGWRSRAHCSRTPRSCSSTRPPRRSTPSASGSCRKPSGGCPRAARRSSSRTACLPSARPTRSRCCRCAPLPAVRQACVQALCLHCLMSCCAGG